MISVARIVVRPSVLNKTRKWQNCGPARRTAWIRGKSLYDFKELALITWSFSKRHHGYVMVMGTGEEKRVGWWHRGAACDHSSQLFLTKFGCGKRLIRPICELEAATLPHRPLADRRKSIVAFQPLRLKLTKRSGDCS
jgi:hypothetical protein